MQARRSDDDHGERIELPRQDEDVTLVLGRTGRDKAEQYREWAERLRTKREAARRRIRNAGAGTEDPTYWTTENVYRESRRLAGEGPSDRDDLTIQALLAVLGISGRPDAHQIESAFRRLAKEHHPDRHVDDDEPTRAYHLEQMHRVNAAYAQLRRLSDV